MLRKWRNRLLIVCATCSVGRRRPAGPNWSATCRWAISMNTRVNAYLRVLNLIVASMTKYAVEKRQQRKRHGAAALQNLAELVAYRKARESRVCGIVWRPYAA